VVSPLFSTTTIFYVPRYTRILTNAIPLCC